MQLSSYRGFSRQLLAADRDGIELEIIMIDNGSKDESVSVVRETYPDVVILENDENNYARALNLGIKSAQGDYIAITNNDATVHPNWLRGLLDTFTTDEKIGAVQSKILFLDSGKINSVGVEEVEHFYFRDIGFNEEDSPLYAQAAEREYVTGGSVMFRRACLGGRRSMGRRVHNVHGRRGLQCSLP